METADLALRSAAIGVLLLLGASVLRQWHARSVGWLGAALALGAVCHLLCPWVVAAWGFSLASLPLLVGCVGVPLLFRWFARALFEERFTWRVSDAWLAVAVLGFGLAEIYFHAGGVHPDAEIRMIVGFIAKLAALGTIVWTVAETFAGRSADLVEPRRRELVAVDLDAGDIRWRVPLGKTAAGVEGARNFGPPLVTAGGLVFVGGTADRKLRAFDADDGNLRASFDLPAGLHGGPMTYRVNGTQYLVVAPGGHAGLPSKLGGFVIAYALRP